jgi:hypothetical protein
MTQDHNMVEFDLEAPILKALPGLLAFEDPALVQFARRDLLDEDPGDAARLLEQPEILKILAEQDPDGYWPYPGRGKSAHPAENYHILQTYRILGFLIDQYGLDRSFAPLARAAEFLFSHQAPEGDIRGIFGSQYAPHYTAGIIELLIKAGYQDDPRVGRSLDWFKDMRGEDGGWAWPLRTAGVRYQEAIELGTPVEPDRGKPFSHALTGFVIRAYAAHPEYRNDALAQRAGVLLKGRFFKPDKYPDRKGAAYWLKFQVPFWWGSLLTALDSLSKLGFSVRDPEITGGIGWFLENQDKNGFWPTGYDSGKGAARNQAWVAFAVCRVLKEFSGI